MACALAARAVPSHAAEDVAHDALMEVLGSLGELRQPFALPLLVRLAVRKHTDRYRRAQIGVSEPIADDLLVESRDLDPAVLAERRHLIMTVRAALQGAPEPDRRLLDLRYFAEWSIRDLATVTGLTEGAIRKRLHDARRRLRPSLAAAQLVPHLRRTRMPDPAAFLGNTYASDGSVLDHNLEGAADRPHLPSFEIESVLNPPGAERLISGVKVIDALAPLTRGGRHEIVGPFGTGHLVLVRELVARANRSVDTVCVAVGSRGWHKGGFSNFHKFGGASSPERNRFAIVLSSGPEDAASALDRGSGLAYALGQHRAVIVAVDDCTAFHAAEQFNALGHGTTGDGHALTLLHVDPYGEGFDPAERPDYHGRLSLSLELAARGVFPAIDPAASRSTLLLGDSPEAMRARHAQTLLTTAEALTNSLAQGLVGDNTDRGQWVDPSVASGEIDQLLAHVIGR